MSKPSLDLPSIEGRGAVAALCVAATVAAGIALAGCVPGPVATGGGSPRHARDAGGFVLVYEFEGDPPADPGETIRVLEERLTNFRFADEATIASLDDGRLEISLPLFLESQLEQAYFLIENPGELEFRILARPGVDVDVIEAATNSDQTAGTVEDTGREWKWVRYDKATVSLSDVISVVRGTEGDAPEVLLLMGPADLDRSHVASAKATVDDENRGAIVGTMTERGARRLHALTSSYLPDSSGRKSMLGIVLDGRLITAPTINDAISEEFMFSRAGTYPEAAALAAMLNGDVLPAKLRQVSIEKFDLPK